MNLESYYLHLALQLFPHRRAHMVGTEFVPECKSTQYALDKASHEHFRIRCIECNTAIQVPVGWDWKDIWKQYFDAKYAQEKVEARIIGLDSRSANPVRVLDDGQRKGQEP